MRQLGVHENLITGTATDYEKYLAWAKGLQSTVGNPIFHWSCMELQELFGIEEVLTIHNADQIWNETNEKLQTEEFTPINIIRRFRIELLCTSDDLLDSLENHIQLKKQGTFFSCLPSLRSDNIFAFHQRN